MRGDTAGRIAAAHKPAQASLEQMLVGLLRANPQAFVGQNVNRLKEGVVIELPDADTVAAIQPTEARRLISAQSRDFNDYRRRLAAAAPTQATPNRAATGTVQTEVTDARPAEAAPDKLTLSKGSDARAVDEAKIAQTRQQADTKARAGELSRNLEELEQLRTTTAPATETPPAAASAPPGDSAAPQVESSTPAPAPAPAPAPVAPPPPPPPAPPAPPPTPEEPAAGGFLNDLLAHPLALPAAGGMAALLGLLALLRLRKRRSTPSVPHDEASDSNFAAAEGQSVDTAEDAPMSSMMYSPSQLDAGGDVDPVAEADVYLAYGRDKQAEEILVEALRLHPDRVPVRAKLLEIHAQRNDVAAYQTHAQALFDLTLGEGPEWAQARDTGLTLDPENPLYHGGVAAVSTTTPEPDALDMDLGFEAPQAPAPSAPVAIDTPTPAPEPEPAPAAPAHEGLDFDFDLSEPAAPPPPKPDLDFDLDLSTPPVASAAPQPEDDPALAFDLDLTGLESTPEPAPPTAAPVATPPAAGHDLDFDFDLSDLPSAPTAAPASELPAEVRDLSLDLDLEGLGDEPTPATADPMADFDDLSSLEVDEGGNADPLETKLSLAREFDAIGDTDGARSLAEEVEAEASGDLQARARAFLAQLS